MNKDYKIELRDKIALVALPVLLLKCHHLEIEQITEYCYNIADTMIQSRDKKENTLYNIKEVKHENTSTNKK
jgi:hypothetical protein